MLLVNKLNVIINYIYINLICKNMGPYIVSITSGLDKIHDLLDEFNEIKNNVNNSKKLDKETEKKIVKIWSEVNSCQREIIFSIERLNQKKANPDEIRTYKKELDQLYSHLEDDTKSFLSSHGRMLKIKDQSKTKENQSLFGFFKWKVGVSDVPSSKYKIVREVATFKSYEESPTVGESLLAIFTPKYINSILDKGRGHIFYTYGKKLSINNLQKKISNLEQQKDRLEIEIERIQREKTDFSQIEGFPSKTEDYVLGEPILLVPVSEAYIERKVNHLKEQIEEITPQLAQLSHALRNKKIEEEGNVNKRKETHKLFMKVGGEEVKLETSDKTTLDGMFIDVDRFKEELKSDGGRFATISCQFPDGRKKNVQGIAFKTEDFGSNKKHVLQSLKNLGGMHNFNINNPGSGWSMISHKDETLVIPDEYLDEYRNGIEGGLFVSGKDNSPRFNPILTDMEISYTEIDITKKGEGGTVILTSGNAGVYEMHKKEALAYLFKGMNVMLFNFRGYGESEGIPSTQGFHRDMITAYEYVKKRTGDPDSKILLSPLCMSGGPAAYVAGKYPEVNIFLNQTYADFVTLIQDEAGPMIEQYFKEWPDGAMKDALSWASKQLKPIIDETIRLGAPGLTVAENIAKNRGHKAIFFVHEDDLISLSHVEKNIQSVMASGGSARLSVFSAPGEHGSNWSSITSSEGDYSRQEVDKKLETLHGDLEKLEHRKAVRTILTEKKTKKLQAILKLVRKGGNARSIKLNGPKLRADEIKLEIEKIWNKNATVQNKLQDEIEAVQNEINALNELFEESTKKSNFTVRAQMDNFLYKAGLGDPIIKTDYQRTRTDSPIMKELIEAEQSIKNLLSETDTVINQFTRLLEAEEISLKIHDGVYTFTLKILGVTEHETFTEENIQKLTEVLDKYSGFDKNFEEWLERTAKESLAKEAFLAEKQLYFLKEKIEGCYQSINQEIKAEWEREISICSQGLDQLTSNFRALERKLVADVEKMKKAEGKEQHAWQKKIRDKYQKMSEIVEEMRKVEKELADFRISTSRQIEEETRHFPEEDRKKMKKKMTKLQGMVESEISSSNARLNKSKVDYEMWLFSPTLYSFRKALTD